MLKYLLLLVLVSLLPPTILSTLGILLGPQAPSFATLKCIHNTGFSYAVLYIVSTGKGIDEGIAQVLTNVKNSEMRTEIVFAPCKGHTVAVETGEFVKKVPKELYDRVWMYANNDHAQQECVWDEENLQQNVRQMIEYVSEFNKSNITIGFLASQEYWDTMFGGSLLFKDLPLFWVPAEPNNTPSFEDYVPFGDWQKPREKLFSEKGTICGTDFSLCYEG